MRLLVDTGARTAPHGDALCPLGAGHAAETFGGVCPECRHYRSDCICWYIAELRDGTRDEPR
jgi:hypothetical protein